MFKMHFRGLVSKQTWWWWWWWWLESACPSSRSQLLSRDWLCWSVVHLHMKCCQKSNKPGSLLSYRDLSIVNNCDNWKLMLNSGWLVVIFVLKLINETGDRKQSPIQVGESESPIVQFAWCLHKQHHFLFNPFTFISLDLEINYYLARGYISLSLLLLIVDFLFSFTDLLWTSWLEYCSQYCLLAVFSRLWLVVRRHTAITSKMAHSCVSIQLIAVQVGGVWVWAAQHSEAQHLPWPSLSVHLSVRHTGESWLNGSTYQNTFCIIQYRSVLVSWGQIVQYWI